MRGYPELNFPAFHAAAAKLRAEGHRVFNPAESGSPQTWNIRDYMSLDLGWICNHADVVYLLPGWQASRGANAERAAAIAIGIDVVEL